MPHGSSVQRPLNWTRLDNAAIIFPPTSRGTDPGVFRMSCRLKETVDPQLLQKTLETTLSQFPHMQVVLRRGLFWYYLEQSDLIPQVEPEETPICAPLYRGSRTLLFRVSWWKDKINLELFHVLADGSGAIIFFQALILCYLKLCHPQALAGLEVPIPTLGRSEDGFAKYYRPGHGKSSRLILSYHLRGSRYLTGQLSAIEGVASVDQVLQAAHKWNTTLTCYLCAVLIEAIRSQMRERDLRLPVALTVPVDLRGYFPSDTARNFFSTIRVAYDFSRRSGTFEDIITQASQSFHEQLKIDCLAQRINALAALEHSPLLRPIPLVVKNQVLRLARWIASLGETLTLSNVGKIHLPQPAADYVREFSIFSGTRYAQLCTCTYGGMLHMGYTSMLRSSEIPQRFFHRLVQDQIQVEIRSNGHYVADTAEREDV